MEGTAGSEIEQSISPHKLELEARACGRSRDDEILMELELRKAELSEERQKRMAGEENMLMELEMEKALLTEEKEKHVLHAQEIVLRRVQGRCRRAAFAHWYRDWSHAIRASAMTSAVNTAAEKAAANTRQIFAQEVLRTRTSMQKVQAIAAARAKELQILLKEAQDLQPHVAALKARHALEINQVEIKAVDEAMAELQDVRKASAEVASDATTAKLEAQRAKQQYAEARVQVVECEQRLSAAQAAVKIERDLRLQHAEDMAFRRLCRQCVARGWTTWLTVYRVQQVRRRIMLSIGGRLRRPRLAAVLAHWRITWQAASMKKTWRAQMQKLQQEQIELARSAEKRATEATGQLKAELHQKQLELAAAQQQLVAEDERSRSRDESSSMRTVQQKKETQDQPAEMKEQLMAESSHHEERAHRAEVLISEQQLQLEVKEQALATAHDEYAAALERQREAEQERYVSHMQEAAFRRLCKQSTARSWAAWLGRHHSQQRHRRIMLSAGARLHRPRLAVSLAHWRRDWEAQLADRTSQAAADRAARQQAESEAKAVTEAEAARFEAEAKALSVVEAEAARLQQEAVAAAERKVEVEAEATRLKAEEDKASRLKGEADDARLKAEAEADAAKSNMEAETKAAAERGALAEAEIARLKTEASAAAEAEADRERAASELTARLKSELQRAHLDLADAQASLQIAIAARAQIVELQATNEELQKEFAAERRAAHENLELKLDARIQHTAEMAARRLYRLSAARAWTTWLAAHRERLRQSRLILSVGARLFRPRVSAALVQWRRNWEAELVSRTITQREKLAAERELEAAVSVRRLRSELQRSNLELAALQDEAMITRVMLEANLRRTDNDLAEANAKLLVEESKSMDLQNQAAMERAEERKRLESELEASKQVAHESLEKERQWRIQHAQETAIRRYINRSIARSWTTWLSFHHEQKTNQRIAGLVILKLRNLRLNTGYAAWLKVWENCRLIEAAQKAEKVRWTALLIKEEHELSEATHAKANTEALLVAQQSLATAEIQSLEAQKADFEAQRASINESLAAERERRIQLAQAVALRHERKQLMAWGFAAWFREHRAHATQPAAPPSQIQTHVVVDHSDSTGQGEGSAWEQTKLAIAAAKEEAFQARRDAGIETRRSTDALEKAARALLSASQVEAEARTLAEQVAADKSKVEQVMRHMALLDIRKQTAAASMSSPPMSARPAFTPTPPNYPRRVSRVASTPPRPRRQSLGLPMSSPKARADAPPSPGLPRSPDYLETLMMMRSGASSPGEEGEPSPKNVGLHRI